jgi:hypothetical protein
MNIPSTSTKVFYSEIIRGKGGLRLKPNIPCTPTAPQGKEWYLLKYHQANSIHFSCKLRVYLGFVPPVVNGIEVTPEWMLLLSSSSLTVVYCSVNSFIHNETIS